MKTLKDAIASIKETREQYRGAPRVRYVCELGTYMGKRQRVVRNTRRECESEVRTFYASVKDAKDNALLLTTAQVFEASEAYRCIRESGDLHTLLYIVSDWLTCNRTASRVMDIAVKEYCARYNANQEVQRGLVERYVGGLLCGYEFGVSPSCADVFASTDRIAKKLRSQYKADSTYNTALGYVKTFARWCAKPCRRYITQEQCEAVCSLERLAVTQKTVEVVTPLELAQMAATLQSCLHDFHDGYYLRFALSFFCGMRSAEIDRCERSWFQKDGTVFVEKAKGYSSRAASRSFMPCETARAWIARCDLDEIFDNGPMPTASEFDWFVTQCEKEHGIRVPKNAGRHSFVTYHSALTGDRSKTLTMAGTSDQMAKLHYRRNATEEDARLYFSVMPMPKMQRQPFTVNMQGRRAGNK